MSFVALSKILQLSLGFLAGERLAMMIVEKSLNTLIRDFLAEETTEAAVQMMSE